MSSKSTYSHSDIIYWHSGIIYIYIYIYLYLYLYLYVHIYMYIHAYIHIYMYICMHVCMYLHIQVHTHTHIHTHTHTHTHTQSIIFLLLLTRFILQGFWTLIFSKIMSYLVLWILRYSLLLLNTLRTMESWTLLKARRYHCYSPSRTNTYR